MVVAPLAAGPPRGLAQARGQVGGQPPGWGDGLTAAVGHPADAGQDGEQGVVALLAAVEVQGAKLPPSPGPLLGETVDVGAHRLAPLRPSFHALPKTWSTTQHPLG